MRCVVGTLAATALAVCLVNAGAPASAATPACPHPEEAVAGGTAYPVDSVALGPGETGEISYEMVARAACLKDYPASIQIATPHRTIPVTPGSVVTDTEQGITTLRGTFVADSSQLTNADAGEWDFQFSAGEVSHAYAAVFVVRRTTLSLDAGPEPLRPHHRLRFRGALEVADWERGRYRGLPDQPIRVFGIDTQTTPVWVPLAEPVTHRHGRYRVRSTVTGPDRYESVYLGTTGIGQATSPIDEVAAPSPPA